MGFGLTSQKTNYGSTESTAIETKNTLMAHANGKLGILFEDWSNFFYQTNLL